MPLLAAALLSSLALPTPVGTPQEARAPRPNILVILADDMGSGDPRCLNPESRIPTPNLDRIAREGMRCTDVHSPSGVCTPTRYGVLTGRYAWRTRLKQGVLVGTSPALIDPERETIASTLKAAGYHTGCVGKWHLGLGTETPVDYSKALHPGPVDYGFDSFFGIPASLDMTPYVYVRDDRVEALPTETIDKSSMARDGGGGFWRGGAIAPGFRHDEVLDRIAEESQAFLQGHADGRPEDPFFLYVPLSAPHTPWLPREPFLGKSEAGPYGDFVVHVDDVVGRILEKLDELEIAENTLVVFTSDNGAHWKRSDIDEHGHRANGTLRGQKADIWEGGHRVPFLVRWPGRVPAGSVRRDLLTLTDLFATCAAAAGVEVPAGAAEDSFNALPALLDEPLESPIRDHAIHHSMNGTFAIRMGRWKLIERLGSGGFSQPKVREPEEGEAPGQLYDLRLDPSETTNLWSKHPALVQRLLERLEGTRSGG